MKFLLLLPIWLLGIATEMQPLPQKATAAQQLAGVNPPRELCQLKGSVYVTDRPEDAHFRVYVEDYETSADLVVYSEENRLFADQPGVWHFTKKPAFANFRIYLTDTKAFSDFSIAYTDVASFAGCR